MNKNIYILKEKYELSFIENNFIEKEIEEKEKERDKIINKNKMLMNSYNFIRENILKKKDDLIIKSFHVENKFAKRIINIPQTENK